MADLLAGRHTDAEQKWLSSLKILELMRDSNIAEIAETYNCLGITSSACYFNNKATIYFQLALKYLERETTFEGCNARARVLSNLATTAIQAGWYSKAEACLDQAAKLYEKSGNLLGLARCTESKGRILLAREQFSAAGRELLKAVRIRRRFDNDSQSLIRIMKYMSRVYLSLGNKRQARKWLEDAYLMAEKNSYLSKWEVYYEDSLICLEELDGANAEVMARKFLHLSKDPIQKAEAHALLGTIAYFNNQSKASTAHFGISLVLRLVYGGIEHPETAIAAKRLLSVVSRQMMNR